MVPALQFLFSYNPVFIHYFVPFGALHCLPSICFFCSAFMHLGDQLLCLLGYGYSFLIKYFILGNVFLWVGKVPATCAGVAGVCAGWCWGVLVIVFGGSGVRAPSET